MEQFGTPEEVYHRPASTFVASFIGVAAHEPAQERAQRAGRAQILGIRPEHLDVTAGNGWAVTVETVELLGAERLIYGRINGEQIIVRVEEGTPRTRNPDSVIHVAPRADRLHAFDASTGKRIAA
jgi:sn-glycerol 3-phosphate transport system ATP-binding protein